MPASGPYNSQTAQPRSEISAVPEQGSKQHQASKTGQANAELDVVTDVFDEEETDLEQVRDDAVCEESVEASTVALSDVDQQQEALMALSKVWLACEPGFGSLTDRTAQECLLDNNSLGNSVDNQAAHVVQQGNTMT